MGYGLVVVAALLWALIGLFSRELLDDGVGALEIGFWRAAVGGTLFVVHGAVRRELRKPAGGDGIALVAFAVVGVTVFFVALPKAVETGGVSLAWVLLYTAPGFVLIAAPVVLREVVTARKVVLAAATMVGVVLVAAGGGEGVHISASSVGWGLLAGASYSSYYLLGKRLLDRLSPVALGALVLPIGAVGLVASVEPGGRSAGTWALLVGIGAVSTYLPNLAYYSGLERVESSRAVVVATIEPVAAFAIAAAVYDERLGALALLGGGLILVAAVASSLPGRR